MGQGLGSLNSGKSFTRQKHTLNKICTRTIERVITQTQARILQAQTRHPDKILSLFEPHSVVIRKGKAHKPNEFGRLVRLDEVENGFVSNYVVAPGNLCDQQQWIPALQAHVELFGQAPRLATADRGFWNSANEKAAAQLGVKQVVLPARGRLSPSRAARQKQRWRDPVLGRSEVTVRGVVSSPGECLR